jgi:murein DD-endopeptidase MepM/ murein hydrolase activator NlpD
MTAERTGLVCGGHAQGTHSGTMARNKLSRIVPSVLAFLALVGAGCGQIGSAREGRSALSKGRLVGLTQASPSPSIQLNGENNGPIPGVRYVVYETKKVKIVRKGKNPLLTCPVHGQGSFSRDFGAPRFAGGYHPHAGNDIFATEGTPIVAPFDGTAAMTPNGLGGLAVKVYGRPGYVYNAHLSRYGKLGPVRAGDVIGFVGNTGDALGGPPHNHFEFHPANGPPVDPYPYIVAACSASRP